MTGWIDLHLPEAVAHVLVSTAFLLLALATAALFRHRLTAAARFAIVFIGVAKFAIPGALLAPVLALLRPEPTAIAPAGGVEASLALLGEALRVEPPPVSLGGWTAAALSIWLLVALVLMLRPAIARRRLTALSLQTALPPAPREVAALGRARERMGVRRSIDIARSALPEAPAVLRVFRPVIVLPMHTCDDLSDEELESLLCHECAHVLRHDNLAARFEWLVCSLFWFNPLLWIAQRVTAIERERACDEAVAASPEEGERYSAALVKFCHALIAPRQPGVSCMATAKLKERIEHVMNYPLLKAHSPSSLRVTSLAVAALIVFTFISALTGGNSLVAGTSSTASRYAVRIDATKSGDSISLNGTISDNTTQTVVAAPRMTFDPGAAATTTMASSGLEVVVDVRPDEGETLQVEVTIRRDGQIEQRSVVDVMPTAIETRSRYSGQPISLQLKNADLRDVLNTFGKITGLEIRPDPDVTGTVSVNWINVPWDEALDSILTENGLTYRIEGSAMLVSKK